MSEQQPPTMPPPPSGREARPAPAKPWYKRWWGITAIVLAVLLVVAVVTGERDEGPVVAETEPDPEVEEVADEPEPPPEPADEPAPTPDPDPTPDPEPEPEEPDRRALLTALAFDPIEHAGSGDDVVDFAIPDDLPGFVELTHAGQGNFAVWARDADGNQTDLLVNTIGSYAGRRAVNLEEPAVALLEVTADGAWTATAHPLVDARELAPDGGLEGDGDDVVVLFDELPGSQRAELTHDGDSNFAIWAWGDRRDLLVNTIGAYDGAVLVDGGTVVLDITADGPWAIFFR